MPYQQFTQSAFVDALRKKVDFAPFWTDDACVAALNEALRLWNLYTSTWRQRRVVTPTNGQTWFTTDALLAHNVRISYNQIPLTYSSFRALDLAQPGWDGQTTASAGVPAVPIIWTPSGLTRFAVWPAAALGASGAYTIDGVRVTPIIGPGFGYLDLDEATFTVILDYALHVLAFPEGGPRFAASMDGYRGFLRAARARNASLKGLATWMGVLGESRTRGGQIAPAGKRTSPLLNLPDPTAALPRLPGAPR